jgi:hypothetical protein
MRLDTKSAIERAPRQSPKGERAVESHVCAKDAQTWGTRRNKTNAPNSQVQKVIDLNKQTYPEMNKLQK